MKINKFKSLSVAICCLVAALWSETQGMEQIRNDEQPVINHQVALPAGIICSFAAETPPDGWLLCHGQQCSSKEYPELYKAIKTKFVPSDEEIRILRNNADEDNIYKLFYVPDLRGRVIVGIDGGTGRITANNTLGESGGTESVTLAINQIPAHNHGLRFTTAGMAGPAQEFYGSKYNDISPIPTENTGGGQPHNNMQPYTCLNYIINTGQANGQQNEIVQLRQKINQLEISQQGCAKAWVVFNGSANILNSYGVSSVTRNGIGIYTINFSNPFNSENYCSSLNAGHGSSNASCVLISGPYLEQQKMDSFKLHTFLPAGFHATDPSFVSACFYGI